MKPSGIYVECSMHAPMEELWRLTQIPEIHQRWDLRFSTIKYLPRTTGESQRFTYTTRIGLGLAIRGIGQTTGEQLSDASRTSALGFSSDDTLSLITEGSGYWRYVPQTDGSIRFFTWYDYRVRFGLAGKLADLLFRPAIGWATAWSFDRLRLLLEDGIPPEVVLQSTAIYTACRLGVCFIWLWHGLVPKLLMHDPNELRMLAEAGLPASMLSIAGWLEIIAALIGLATWRYRGYLLATAIVMLFALAAVALRSPEYIGAAFTPVTLNLAVILLCLACRLAWPATAFAGRCLRRDPRERNGGSPTR